MANYVETFGTRTVDITVDEISNFDDLCRTSLHLGDSFTKKRAESYDRTRQDSIEVMSCKAMYKPFEIEDRDDTTVVLQGGIRLNCPVIARALQDAVFTVAFAVTAHGFEELLDKPDNSMLDSMMYGGWGVGFSTGGQQWFESEIRERAHELGFYTGKSWSPGLEDVSMELQRPLYDMLDAGEIGIELTDALTMRPTMSVAGLIGVGSDTSIEQQETLWMI